MTEMDLRNKLRSILCNPDPRERMVVTYNGISRTVLRVQWKEGNMEFVGAFRNLQVNTANILRKDNGSRTLIIEDDNEIHTLEFDVNDFVKYLHIVHYIQNYRLYKFARVMDNSSTDEDDEGFGGYSNRGALESARKHFTRIKDIERRILMDPWISYDDPIHTLSIEEFNERFHSSYSHSRYLITNTK